MAARDLDALIARYLNSLSSADLDRFDRVQLAEDPRYLHCRKAVIDFLYTRQAHVEKLAA